MTLGEKQRLFAKLFGEFLVWIFEQPGYAVRIDEVQRTQEQANLNAVAGSGISNSLHILHLAGDLSLYINGVYQTDSKAYQPLGEEWESMHELCRWGGRFHKPDGDHFSLEHEGVK